MILIIDDDASFRATLAETLSDLGFESRQASGVQEALNLTETFDTIFIDFKMPGMNGIEGLKRFKHTPVVMITSVYDAGTTIEAISEGAFDYLTKPVRRKQIEDVLSRIRAQHGAAAPSAPPPSAFVAVSDNMREVLKLVGRVTNSDVSVLITGETGTGKELIARLIHDYGPRSKQPFVAINCAAIPGDLLESELFGHVKGSFTGAATDREGAFLRARAGTIFLDEIGDMPLALQAKLLRVLQEKEVTPVGGTRSQKVEARFLAATHQNLQAKGFRDDLRFRLNTFEIDLPPLRERRDDIEALANAFLLEGKRFSTDALAKIKSYEWPGNVRELKNVVERASLMTSGPVIVPDAIRIASSTTDAAAPKPGFTQSVEQLEKEMIVRALSESNNNRSEAARKLGIGRQLLYAKLKEFKIQT